MSGVIWSDGFGSLEIIVYFFAIEDIEYELSTGMHEVFINVIHSIVYDDIANPFFFVCFEVLLLL